MFKWTDRHMKVNEIENNEGDLRKSAVNNNVYCFVLSGCASEN